MKKIILISGKAENGKTFSANYIKTKMEEYGYKVVITRYAQYLKSIAMQYCGWDGNKDINGRNLLQQLGTDIIRIKYHKPLFHVSRVCEDIELTQEYYDYVIIDDARYINEIMYPYAIFNDKVITIRVNRFEKDMKTPYDSSLTQEQKQHISETSLDNFSFDFVINSYSIEDKKNKLDKIIKEIID